MTQGRGCLIQEGNKHCRKDEGLSLCNGTRDSKFLDPRSPFLNRCYLFENYFILQLPPRPLPPVLKINSLRGPSSCEKSVCSCRKPHGSTAFNSREISVLNQKSLHEGYRPDPLMP